MHKSSHQPDQFPQTAIRGNRRFASSSLRPSRRGALLVELIVGAVLLSVFLGATLPLISWVRSARRNTADHRLAATELSNQMERISAWAPDARTQQRLNQLDISDETAATLADAVFTATATQSPRFPELQQITLALSWKDRSGVEVRPVRLTALFRFGSN
ncbi:MAG: type IV pilus modification PilV family protein [Planctomycetota bacterium]|jgi:type II secretory pathway pseudopilin PulG